MRPHALIIRHNKENKKKCSLRGLESRDDLLFRTFPLKAPLDLSHAYLLSFDGPSLTEEDRDKTLVLLDGTWRYAEQMFKALPQLHTLPKRSLPTTIQTAYPRRQEDCMLPHRGLASVEALAVSFSCLGREWLSLLKHYYWHKEFLEMNKSLFPQQALFLI